MSDAKCKYALRRLELEAYCSVVSALRAQGDLTADKRRLLKDLQSNLRISLERHRAEVRRAVNDDRLKTIAHGVSDEVNVCAGWQLEGRRLVPVLPRVLQPPLSSCQPGVLPVSKSVETKKVAARPDDKQGTEPETVILNKRQKKFEKPLHPSRPTDNVELLANYGSDVNEMEREEEDEKTPVHSALDSKVIVPNAVMDSPDYQSPSGKIAEHIDHQAVSTNVMSPSIQTTVGETSCKVSQMAPAPDWLAEKTPHLVMNATSFSQLTSFNVQSLSNESQTTGLSTTSSSFLAHTSGEIVQVAEMSANDANAVGSSAHSQPLVRSPTSIPVTISRGTTSVSTRPVPYQTKPPPTPKVIIVSGTGLSTATTICGPPPAVTTALSSVSLKNSPVKLSIANKAISSAPAVETSRLTSKSSALTTTATVVGEAATAPFATIASTALQKYPAATRNLFSPRTVPIIRPRLMAVSARIRGSQVSSVISINTSLPSVVDMSSYSAANAVASSSSLFQSVATPIAQNSDGSNMPGPVTLATGSVISPVTSSSPLTVLTNVLSPFISTMSNTSPSFGVSPVSVSNIESEVQKSSCNPSTTVITTKSLQADFTDERSFSITSVPHLINTNTNALSANIPGFHLKAISQKPAHSLVQQESDAPYNLSFSVAHLPSKTAAVQNRGYGSSGMVSSAVTQLCNTETKLISLPNEKAVSAANAHSGGHIILSDTGGVRRNVIVVPKALPSSKLNMLSEIPPVSASVKITSPFEKELVSFIQRQDSQQIQSNVISQQPLKRVVTSKSSEEINVMPVVKPAMLLPLSDSHAYCENMAAVSEFDLSESVLSTADVSTDSTNTADSDELFDESDRVQKPFLTSVVHSSRQLCRIDQDEASSTMSTTDRLPVFVEQSVFEDSLSPPMPSTSQSSFGTIQPLKSDDALNMMNQPSLNKLSSRNQLQTVSVANSLSDCSHQRVNCKTESLASGQRTRSALYSTNTSTTDCSSSNLCAIDVLQTSCTLSERSPSCMLSESIELAVDEIPADNSLCQPYEVYVEDQSYEVSAGLLSQTSCEISYQSAVPYTVPDNSMCDQSSELSAESSTLIHIETSINDEVHPFHETPANNSEPEQFLDQYCETSVDDDKSLSGSASSTVTPSSSELIECSNAIHTTGLYFVAKIDGLSKEDLPVISLAEHELHPGDCNSLKVKDDITNTIAEAGEAHLEIHSLNSMREMSSPGESGKQSVESELIVDSAISLGEAEQCHSLQCVEEDSNFHNAASSPTDHYGETSKKLQQQRNSDVDHHVLPTECNSLVDSDLVENQSESSDDQYVVTIDDADIQLDHQKQTLMGCDFNNVGLCDLHSLPAEAEGPQAIAATNFEATAVSSAPDIELQLTEDLVHSNQCTTNQDVICSSVALDCDNTACSLGNSDLQKLKDLDCGGDDEIVSSVIKSLNSLSDRLSDSHDLIEPDSGVQLPAVENTPLADQSSSFVTCAASVSEVPMVAVVDVSATLEQDSIVTFTGVPLDQTSSELNCDSATTQMDCVLSLEKEQKEKLMDDEQQSADACLDSSSNVQTLSHSVIESDAESVDCQTVNSDLSPCTVGFDSMHAGEDVATPFSANAVGKRKRKTTNLAEKAEVCAAAAVSSWIRQALILLNRVMKLRNFNGEKNRCTPSSWFNQPVDAEEVPDYYDVIKNPMDFSTIKKKLETGVYKDWSGFHADMLLVHDNCVLYNAVDTQVRQDCDLVFNFYHQELSKSNFKLSSQMPSSASKRIKFDVNTVQ